MKVSLQGRRVRIGLPIFAALLAAVIHGSVSGVNLLMAVSAFACLTTTLAGALAAIGWLFAYVVILPFVSDFVDARILLHAVLSVILAAGEWPRYRRGESPPLMARLQAPVFLVAVLVASLRFYPMVIGIAWAVFFAARVAACRFPRAAWKGAFVNGTLATTSVLVTVVVVDLFARFVLGWAYVNADLYRYHPEAFHTHNPNGRGTFMVKMPEGPPLHVPVAISSQGLREDRVYGPKAPDEFRILMLGDSFTQGYGVALEETIGRRLEHYLLEAVPGKRITVMNGGIGAYAPWQSLIFLKETGLALDPDLVIHELFPSNDVDGMLDREDLRLRSVNGTRVLEVWNARQWGTRLMQFDLAVQRYSALYAQWQRVTEGRRGITANLRRTRFFAPVRQPGTNGSVPRSPYIEYLVEEDYPELNLAWGSLLDTLSEAHALCAENGIDYAVYGVPFMAQVHEPNWKDLLDAAPGYAYDKWKDYRLIRERCEAVGIAFIDIATPLQVAGDPLALYFEKDGHFQAMGCDVVGRALSAWYLGRVDSPAIVPMDY